MSVLQFLNIGRPQDLSMNMGFTAEDEDGVSCFLTANGIEARSKFAVVAPMSTWVTRNWPAKRYAEIADSISAELGLPIILIGSKREHDAVATISDLMSTKPVIAAGVFKFREVAALIASASILLGGDSGPMHVAGAVGTPYVAVFGSTPIDGRQPLVGQGQAVSFAVPCGPCDWHQCSNKQNPLVCLESIQVSEVLAAVKSILELPNCPHVLVGSDRQLRGAPLSLLKQ